jgi:hypothetical protein
MTTNLKSRLEALASSFASSVLDAVRSTSLEELLVDGASRAAPRGPGRPKAAPKPAAASPKPAARARASSGGRLARRSAQDIAKALDQVVALVKKHKSGLRSEQIRSELKMRANEMPRVLKEGVAKRVLKSKGQKRATTYFAA